MSRTPAIYARFLEHCQPIRLADAWRGVVVDADGRACPAGGTAVLASLVEEFLEYDLVASGVASQLPDGLVLNSQLAGAEKSVIALRAAVSALPYALVTAGGTILEGRTSPLTILADAYTQALMASTGPRALVAFTIDDMIVLRSLGLPATLARDLPLSDLDQLQALERACRWVAPVVQDDAAESVPRDAQSAAGLAEMATPSQSEGTITGPQEVQSLSEGAAVPPELCDRPAADSMADEARQARETNLERDDHADEPIELVLVAWSPANVALEEPSEFIEYARALSDAERYLEIDVSRVAVWRPTAEMLQQVRYCLGIRAVDRAARTIVTSAADSLFVLDTVAEPRARESVFYSVARQRLEALLWMQEDEQQTGELREAIRSFDAAIEEDLGRPLRAQVLADEDPTRRILGMVVVDLAKCLLRHAPFIELAIPRLLNIGPGAARRSSRQLALGEILEVADRIVTFVRELRR